MSAKDAAGRFAKMGRQLGGGGSALLGAAALIYGIKESIYTVEGGHRSVIFSRLGGVKNEIYGEGLHFRFTSGLYNFGHVKPIVATAVFLNLFAFAGPFRHCHLIDSLSFRIPWFQYPIIYNIRSRPTKVGSPTGTKDLQMVNINLRVLTRPDSAKLPLITQTIGTNYDEKVLPSIVNEVLKSVVAKFNASQLITQRAQVSLLIKRELTDRANDFHLILDDVAITDLTFSREFTHAIEAKQVAQQDAQRAQYIVERAIQERQQKIVQAEGEAQIAKTLGEAISKNPAYLKLRQIRAAQSIARTISQSQNKVYLDANNLMLNISDILSDGSPQTNADTLRPQPPKQLNLS